MKRFKLHADGNLIAPHVSLTSMQGIPFHNPVLFFWIQLLDERGLLNDFFRFATKDTLEKYAIHRSIASKEFIHKFFFIELDKHYTITNGDYQIVDSGLIKRVEHVYYLSGINPEYKNIPLSIRDETGTVLQRLVTQVDQVAKVVIERIRPGLPEFES